MCGIAGKWSDDSFNLNSMRSVLEEIGIRGIHSTGVSFLSDGEIITKIQNVPYYEFELPNVMTKGAVIHCRYSTSNIDYPQPVFNSTKAVVHNGVITQSDPENWGKDFGYYGDSKNDSALLLCPSDHPLEFEGSSMAVIELHKDRLMFYRNGKRPLYRLQTKDSVTVASTNRALDYIGEKLTPSMEYINDTRGNGFYYDFKETSPDLQ